MRYVVAPVSDFPPRSRRIVRVGGREIGIFNVDGAFYAVRNRCPHQGAPLCLGHVRRRLVSETPGEFRLADGAPLIVCPWHAWQYDACTGQAYAPGDPAVRSYRVAVEAGVEVERQPFVAETFAVDVEDDYVVLEA